MSREILFRGKRIDNGEWVEGYYTLYPYGKAEISKRCDNAPDGDPMWKKVLITYKVAPETVCQYTGLTDKNGRKIWENDRCRVERTCVLAYGVIKYLEGCFCFLEDGTGNILRLCDVRTNGYDIKIDGNIFDNPELIS